MSINTSQCFSVRPTLCPTDIGDSKLTDQQLLLYWFMGSRTGLADPRLPDQCFLCGAWKASRCDLRGQS